MSYAKIYCNYMTVSRGNIMKRFLEEKRPQPDIKFTYHLQEPVEAGIIAPLQYHEFIEILYCVSGEYHVTVNRDEYSFSKGDMVFIGSRQLHKVICDCDCEHNKYIVLKISASIIFDSCNSSDEMNRLRLFLCSNSKDCVFMSAEELEEYNIDLILDKLIKEYENDAYCKDMAISLYVQELFLVLMRIWNARGSIITVSNNGMCLAEWFYDVFNYVNNNYSEKITASTVAKKYCVSYSYFSQIFKRITMMSFTKYLNHIRISEAENLLINTDYSITEIAGSVGFDSVSYFIKIFREHNGMSPYKFRQSIKKQEFDIKR